MSKDRREPVTGAPVEPPQQAPTPPQAAPTVLAENESLKQQLAALQEQLRNQQAKINVPGQIPEGTVFFRVELKYGPTHVVAAKDPANAWETYKDEMGVVTSEHQATVMPATEDEWKEAQMKRFGLHARRPRGLPLAPDPEYRPEAHRRDEIEEQIAVIRNRKEPAPTDQEQIAYLEKQLAEMKMSDSERLKAMLAQERQRKQYIAKAQPVAA